MEGDLVMEQRSVGSELAEEDQFDIIVPTIKLRDRRIEMGGDSITDVSSITTDDRRGGGGHYSGARSQSSSWCCFSGATETTVDSENTVLKSRAEAFAKRTSRNAVSDLLCCADETMKIKKHRRKSTRSSREDKSLFDSLSDDEEETGKNRRKWRASFLRKARSLKKRNSRLEYSRARDANSDMISQDDMNSDYPMSPLSYRSRPRLMEA